jgi:acyl-CoA synthetase (AMP-forming)/AMP-acid ligase II
MNFNWVLDTIDRQIPAGDPDKTAIRFGPDQSLTYGELRERSLRYATALRELGLAKGDRLGLLLNNDLEYVPLYMAAARLGVVPVRINFRLASPEVAFILNDSGSEVLIAHSSLIEKVAPIREETGIKRTVVLADSSEPLPAWAEDFETLRSAEPLDLETAPAIAAEDPLTLAYTFGVASLASGNLTIMAAVMAAGMVPPLAMALSTVVRPKLYTRSERQAGEAAWLLGASFITEGAIPFAAADPLRVIPSLMAGSAVTGAMSLGFGATSRAPHGGIWVVGLIGKPLLYVLAIVVGVLISTLCVTFAKSLGESDADFDTEADTGANTYPAAGSVPAPAGSASPTGTPARS